LENYLNEPHGSSTNWLSRFGCKNYQISNHVFGKSIWGELMNSSSFSTSSFHFREDFIDSSPWLEFFCKWFFFLSNFSKPIAMSVVGGTKDVNFFALILMFFWPNNQGLLTFISFNCQTNLYFVIAHADFQSVSSGPNSSPLINCFI